MRRRVSQRAAAVVAACTVLAACGSSGGSSSVSASRPTGSKTITIGLISDQSGAASSSFVTDVKGVSAYVDRINAAGGVDGYKIKYVVGDTTSTPTGALTAAQKLVQQDNVFAIIEDSSVFFGAEPWLLQAGIPVVGSAVDGPYWSDPKDTNLFAASGVNNEDYMSLGLGRFMKAQGVTSCASIGYSNSVSSQLTAEGFIKSCQAAGLKSGYLNTQIPLGSTNVGPIALAIKNAGVDGLYLPVIPNTAFALVIALHLLGVKLKTALLATGYGGDLLASKPAVQAGQGLDFSTAGAPAEAGTAATAQRAADLAKVAVTGDPTFAEMEGYLVMSAFVAGLRAAGANPTRQSFMKAIGKISNFDADGLLVPNKIAFHNYAPSSSCVWVVQLKGEKFSVVPGTPICAPLVKFSNQSG
jgi:branched-chain amino acid transport system substrate-binding protein